MKMTTSPKSEILNPKQSQNPKFKCFKLKPVGVLNFVHLNFEFISNFVLRASNFPAMMVFLFLSLFIPLAGRAGGPFVVNDEGVASTWDTSDTTPITIHPESGACATFSNDEMIDKIDENISVWSDIASVSLSFAPVASTNSASTIIIRFAVVLIQKTFAPQPRQVPAFTPMPSRGPAASKVQTSGEICTLPRDPQWKRRRALAL